MLETMRSHAQSWIAKLILGGIVLSFALWGIGDYFLGSRLQAVAEIDGEPIPEGAFVRAYERQLNTYRALLGKRFSKAEMDKLGVKQTTLQTLINRRLMLAEAHALGLTAPQAALVASIRANPAFQTAGRFDPSRYQILTRSMGFRTAADFEQGQRLDLMIEALQKALMESAIVTDEEAHARFAREYERRVLAAIIVDPLLLEKDVRIDTEQAKDFYQAQREQYRSPLRLKLTAVRIDAADLAQEIEVSDEELKAAFAEHKDEFRRPERRRARHILIRVDKDADAKARAAARKRIEAALARVRQGEDFATVAKEVSEDKATAGKGGDLGFFARGVMVPAFEKAVFAMHKGEISDVVQTPFGFHIIQLLDIEAAKQPTLAEVRDKLAARLKRQKALDEAYRLSRDLDDALGREDSLEAAAAALNLPRREIGPISKEEALADQWLGGNAAFRARVFQLNPGDPVEVEELGDGVYMAVEVVQRLKPQVLPFAKVAARVLADAKRAQAKQKARALAEKILAAAKQPLDELAQTSGQPKFISKPVTRNGSGDDAPWLTQAVLDAAFGIQAGQVAEHVIEVPQGLAVVKVARIIAAPEADYAKQAPVLRRELRREKGAVRFARWLAAVRDRHEIKIHQDLLARF